MNKGFVKIRRGLIDHLSSGKLPGFPFLLLLYLILKADYNSGIVNRRSASFIAQELEVHKNTVQRALKRLESKGYIKRFLRSRGDHRGYPILINKYDVPEKGRVVAEKSPNIRHIFYEKDSEGVAEGVLEGVAEGVENNKKKERKNKKYIYTKFDSDFAKSFYEKLAKPHGAQNPDLRKWSNEVRLIRERDGRSEQYLLDCLEAVSADNFWNGVCLSPAGLRKYVKSGQVRPTMINTKKNPGESGNNLKGTSPLPADFVEWLRRNAPEFLEGGSCESYDDLTFGKKAVQIGEANPDTIKGISEAQRRGLVK